MELRRPYLLFLGDARDALAAKTALGIVDWRRDWCLGQLRLPGCQADAKLPDMSVKEAAAAGAKAAATSAASMPAAAAQAVRTVWLPMSSPRWK